MSTLLATESDIVVRVNRQKAVEPLFGASFEYPRMQNDGPEEFVFRDFFWFLCPRQDKIGLLGRDIQAYLEDNQMFNRGLNLADGKALCDFFNQEGCPKPWYKGKELVLWKALSRTEQGGLVVPCLVKKFDNPVTILARDINRYFSINSPALLFKA